MVAVLSIELIGSTIQPFVVHSAHPDRCESNTNCLDACVSERQINSLNDSAILLVIALNQAIFIPTAEKLRVILDHAHKIACSACCIKYLGIPIRPPYTECTARGTVQPG